LQPNGERSPDPWQQGSYLSSNGAIEAGHVHVPGEGSRTLSDQGSRQGRGIVDGTLAEDEDEIVEPCVGEAKVQATLVRDDGQHGALDPAAKRIQG
jgi:hypothetical protein